VANDVKAAHAELTAKVIGRDGISGTAIGRSDGRPVLKVYVRDREAGKGVPKSVGGFPVDVEVTGSFRRL
jgi:hypothetical protein